MRNVPAAHVVPVPEQTGVVVSETQRPAGVLPACGVSVTVSGNTTAPGATEKSTGETSCVYTSVSTGVFVAPLLSHCAA